MKMVLNDVLSRDLAMRPDAQKLDAWLDKAEQRAAAKNFCIDILLTGRLAPDQKPFIYQVQSADYVKAGAAWLSGQIPPKHEDNEKAIEEVRARIKKTVAFVDSVKEEQYGGPRAVE
jgi:hypothetical protein